MPNQQQPLNLTAFTDTVTTGGRSGLMFVDTNILVNFDRIGKLDTLLAANRQIVITPEVFREAVVDAQASNNPNAVASAGRILEWINQKESIGNVTVDPSNPGRSEFVGKDAGERSIVADVQFLNGRGAPIIVSDDNSMALQVVDGSSTPIQTGNYFLNSLLIGWAITPNDYFQTIAAGAPNFNQSTAPGDAS